MNSQSWVENTVFIPWLADAKLSDMEGQLYLLKEIAYNWARAVQTCVIQGSTVKEKQETLGRNYQAKGVI